MRFRNLDTNGDWTFGNGTNSYAQKDDAIALNIRTRIMSWLNDCFFAQTAGIDWANRLGSKGEQVLLEADIRRIIIQSYGVTGLTSLNISLISRKLSVEYAIVTIYSPSYLATITGDFNPAKAVPIVYSPSTILTDDFGVILTLDDGTTILTV